ncbi:Lon protease [Methylobacterium cerastii]|uniref:Lon protease n=1 Tax=Methylobacterium cerastii TaxID=932741 RepID=A0ABQ4QDX2_9HYPH|nr:AAA family ATPase [Methylobacterium cerastii]GJD43191.1 Lon protease [Methylobacterium cerastii]
MRTTPRNGVGAPSVRGLLLGMPFHRHSHPRQLQAELLSTVPGIYDGSRDELVMQCAGSNLLYELVMSLWAAINTCLDAKRDPDGAQKVFAESLYEAWKILKRTVGCHTAVTADHDLAFAFDDRAEQDLLDLLTILLSDMGYADVRMAYVELAWRHARDRQKGEDDLLFGAIGASLYARHDLRFRQWTAGVGPTGFVESCIAFGRDEMSGKFAMAPAEPSWATEAKKKSALQKIEAARAEAGPSLLVLSSVDHLPGSATSGEGRPGGSVGTTARAEWAPMAGKRLPLVVVPDLARVKRRLVREFPDCERIIDAVLAPLAGRQFAYLSPFLLVGAPGSGKSRLARRIGEELGLAVTVYACSGVSDSSIIGTSRMWSTGRASVPLQAIRRAGAASVLIVLDEIARAGTRTDNGKLTDGVLGLTERETARAYQDPYLECPVDLSAVSYVATANTVDGLDPALLSRFRVFEMPMPTARSLPVLARAIVAELRVERGLDAVWLPDLTPDEFEMIGSHWSGGSVRVLQQLVEVAVDGRDLGQAN